MKKFIKIVSPICLTLLLFACSKKEDATTSATVKNEKGTTTETVSEDGTVTAVSKTITDATSSISVGGETLVIKEDGTKVLIKESGEEVVIDDATYEKLEEEMIAKKSNIEEEQKENKTSSSSSSTKTTSTKTTATAKKEYPPRPVTDLKAEFKPSTNEVVLTWTEPDSENYSYLMISENGKDMGVKVLKGQNSINVKPLSKTDNTYTLTTFSDTELKGKSVTSNPIKAYMFKSLSLPPTGVKGGGNKVTAKLTGVNFTTPLFSAKDIKLSCEGYESAVRKSDITIIDDENLTFSVTIPKRVGNFKITAKCGEDSISQTLVVKETPEVFTIVEEGGKPVAIITGYSSAGIGIGMGLKEMSNKQWAIEGSSGFNTTFQDIISIPTKLGTGSAEEASFNEDIDGKDNWDAITKVDTKCLNADGSVNMSYVQTNYPLFHSALVYGRNANIPLKYRNGWFVPSIKELCDIYNNGKKLNHILKDLGGDLLSDDFYWSSSQNENRASNACALRFQNGAIFKFYPKSNAVFARIVREFPEL